MSLPTEPLSPELALVSPDLAARARAELPERPWEVFLPAGRGIDVLPLPIRRQTQSYAVPVEAPAKDEARRARRRRVPVAPLVLLGFVGLVATGSILPTRDAPSLAPPQATAGNPSPDPAPAPSIPSTPSRTTDREPPPRPSASSGTRIAQPTLPGPTTPSTRGYVLTNGKGFLQVDGTGRSIIQLRVMLPCAGAVVLRSIVVDTDGRFRARRQSGIGARIPLVLAGRITSLTSVRGSIRVLGGDCRDVALRFVGRLS